MRGVDLPGSVDPRDRPAETRNELIHVERAIEVARSRFHLEALLEAERRIGIGSRGENRAQILRYERIRDGHGERVVARFSVHERVVGGVVELRKGGYLRRNLIRGATEDRIAAERDLDARELVQVVELGAGVIEQPVRTAIVERPVAGGEQRAVVVEPQDGGRRNPAWRRTVLSEYLIHRFLRRRIDARAIDAGRQTEVRAALRAAEEGARHVVDALSIRVRQRDHRIAAPVGEVAARRDRGIEDAAVTLFVQIVL